LVYSVTGNCPIPDLIYPDQVQVLNPSASLANGYKAIPLIEYGDVNDV